MGGEDYKLTYFNVKGVAEPIRFIFGYAGIKYEDNRVERADWPEIKNTTPWGTLPLLQVGDKTLGQSNVICRYLGKKFNLSGSDDWENAKIDEFADALTDFGTASKLNKPFLKYLTNFNVKAVGEPIRFIFAYAGVKYEDNRVEHADWPEMKSTTPWGTLPLLQVGDKTLGQSNAICRYLGKKFHLDGDNDWENAKIDEFADAVADFRMAWARTFKEKDEARKAEMVKEVSETIVPQIFGTLEATIAGNNGSPYLVGKKLTWVDLLTAHYLDFFENLNPGVLIKYPNLIKLKTLVYQTEQIKAWCAKRPATNM